jgi:uncharacterized phage-associated protein
MWSAGLVASMNASHDIADEILGLATEDTNTLTPMQLLKLVYISHGWMLGLYSVPLISDRVEAWKYGPVIPELYHSIKRFRDTPVLIELRRNHYGRELYDVEKDLLKQVYGIYGRLSGITLSRMTHRRGTPWHRVYRDGVGEIIIPNDIIEEHYKILAQA